MLPSNPTLGQLLGDLLKSEDVSLRARAENFCFDERVGRDRQARYEAEYEPTGPFYDQWLESHMDYLSASVYTEQPETFLPLNGDAALPAAVSSELGEEQVLIRVESLDYALRDTKVSSLADLENILAIYNGQRRDPNLNAGDAKALLQEVCRSLNQNPNAVRPRFAAFAQELSDYIESPDWPLRLRDRLGLAHLPPTLAFGPYPVALMKYKVSEVAGRAGRVGAAHPLVVPTVLDAEPYEIFYPSPKDFNFGRTLNLSGAGNCDQLASEVLHLRIDYSPGHIWKVGAITTRADTSPERLSNLRNDHLACLQLLSNRDDFGIL